MTPTPKRGRGRPPLPPDERQERLDLRLPRADMEALAAFASARGTTLYRVACDILQAAAKRARRRLP